MIIISNFSEHELGLEYMAKNQRVEILAFLEKWEILDFTRQSFEDLNMIQEALDNTYIQLSNIFFPKKEEIHKITHGRKKYLVRLFWNQLELFEIKFNPLFFMNCTIETIFQKNWNNRIKEIRQKLKPIKDIIMSDFNHREARILFSSYTRDFKKSYMDMWFRERVDKSIKDIVQACHQLGFTIKPIEQPKDQKIQEAKS